MLEMHNQSQIALNSLIARQKPGFCLERPFYSDESIYRADIQKFWRTGWVFAAHSCEIPKPGDFLTLQIDSDPILVTRGEDNKIRAFHNVCRHRGSVICSEASGQVTRLVCPYHQWVY